MNGIDDAFVTKLNKRARRWCTPPTWEATAIDQGAGIAVDSAGNAYVTGFTFSTNFPTTAGAFQTTNGGGTDAFVTKLNAAGTALVYSTYLGGSGNDDGHGIAVDSAGNAYVTGFTISTNFPTTPGAFQTTNSGGNGDAFVAKFRAVNDAVQVNYAANLKAGASIVNLSNAGSDPAGAICANVYVFAEDEQLIACCTCPLTPNGLATLSVENDLISNTLTPGAPSAITTLLVATSGTCNTPVTAPNVASGLRAWGTTLHAAPAGGFSVTERPFSLLPFSDAELAQITATCGFIQSNGSGHGICGSCQAGAAGATRK